MEYCITMERTQRIKVNFSAENDDEAEEHAGKLYEHAKQNPAMFSGGETEHDYALTREDGRTIFDFDRFD